MNYNNNDDYKRDMRLETPPPAPHHAAPPRRPSRFWLFMLSLLPGTGHMYLGLIRRGLFYMTSLALLIFLTTVIAPSALVILTSFAKAALFAVAFFESFAIRRDIVMGKEVADTVPTFSAHGRNKSLLVLVLVVVAILVSVNILSSLNWIVWLVLGIVAVAIFTSKKKSRDDSQQ